MFMDILSIEDCEGREKEIILDEFRLHSILLAQTQTNREIAYD